MSAAGVMRSVVWAAAWLMLALAAPAFGATVEYLHTDALGSVVSVSNSAGTVVERREYEPYGRQLVPAVPEDGPGYTGHVSDAATGLSYMQQRYYDPVAGRFLSVDPVTADVSTGLNFNRYWYANNNPYRFTDPDGRIGYELNQGQKIIIPVYFQGSGASPERIAAILDRANSLVVEGIRISVVQAHHAVGGVNVMNLAPHSSNPYTQYGEGVVSVPGFEYLGPMAAHINSLREDVVGAAVHDILHFVNLEDGYIEGATSTFGSRAKFGGFKSGYTEDQIMADTGGNQVRSHETRELRSPNNGMMSGVEWRRVEGRLDAKRQEEERR